MPPALLRFELAADELRRQEFARLADAMPPILASLRSLTLGDLRAAVAVMLERLGYVAVTDPSAHDLTVTKDGRKYILACAPPTDLAPTRTAALARLHDAVVVASAEAGFYISTRAFTPEAEDYAATAPIRLVDGETLVASMTRSKAGIALPESYKVICRQCGDLVRHRLDRAEALSCRNGHPVAPTIARAALVPRPDNPADAAAPQPDGAQPLRRKWRNMSVKAQRGRAIRAHNRGMRARALRK